MFIDQVTFTLSAGKGGNGVVAWRREKYIPKGGPAGGDGGNGGSITLIADEHTFSLQAYRNKRTIKAENGKEGGGNQKKGRSGENLVLKVPVGTLVKEHDTLLCDLTEHGQEFLVCQGGKGGKGNVNFKTPTRQAPNICTPGTEGETKDIELELKMIADVGLVGFPNAGKSTLLSSITAHKVKIGAYPFTTLHPNLSYIARDDFSRVLIADIPGIIKDAHDNRGLGLEFLKHIERTEVLVHLIDIAATEGRDPLEDFAVLRSELVSYSEDMGNKPFLVALNKVDLPGAQEQVDRFLKESNLPKNQVFVISAQEKQGLSSFIEALVALAQQKKKRFY